MLVQRRYRPGWIVEEVAGIERAVPDELQRTAAEPIGARLRDDVDQRGRLAAKLGGIHRLLNLEFLNRVDRRADDEIVEVLVGDFHPVDEVDVVAASGRTRWATARLSERGAARSAWRNRDTVGELGQVDELASVDGNACI